MYVAELDISHEPTHQEVCEFAQEHGCAAKLILENGPAGGNPLYQFSSENKHRLFELVSQVLGFADDHHIFDTIREV